VIYGVWAHKDLPDTKETRFAALELVLTERTFVCGPTAAWAGFDIDIQDPRSNLLWVGHTSDTWLKPRSGFLIRELSLDPTDVQIFRGTRMTTWLRTAFDCARWLPLVEAVVVVDALAHIGAITLDELSAYLASHRGVTGAKQIARVIDLADPRSESPMETRVRLLLVLSGLPRPETQVIIEDENGKFVARADMGYPHQRLLIEYDGAWHWQQRAEDERRRQRMRDLGWTVIVVTKDDYYKTPAELVTRVSAKLV
jgi:very-short-patch-repair endonuclease